jgi:structural maintenance of chromosome 2
MINGVNAPQQTVENLFSSVQLSVNHPHFLIMQGRVTKLLAMKAVEIGAMLEETAGTRMYEEHKGRALVTIEKKARKVAEIEDALGNNIGPRLAKLRDERQQWQQWQVLQQEVRELEQIVLVQTYWASRAEQESLKEKLQQDENRLAMLKAQIAEKEGEGRQLTARVAKLQSEQSDNHREEEKQVMQRHKEVQKEVAHLEARMTTIAKAQQDTKIRLSELNVLSQGNSKSKNQKNPALQDAEALKRIYETEMGTFESERDALRRLEEVQTGLTTGLTTDSKTTGQLGYDKLIADEHARLLALQGELQRGRTRAATLDASLETTAPILAKLEQKVEEKRTTLVSAQMQVENLRKRLVERVEDGGEAILQKERLQVANQLAALAPAPSPFTFVQPTDKSFDARKVYGRVGELISVKDSNWNLALEVAAGSRLQNVVVASEREASILLEQGQLKARTTFLPLSKMVNSTSIIPAMTMARILSHPQHGSAVVSALDAISFEDSALLPAMQFVFGNMLLCRTKLAASFFAYDAAFRVRCVTLDGDLYDPSGTLTGGGSSSSKETASGLLTRMQQNQERSVLMAKLKKLDAQLALVSEARAKQGDLERQLDFALHAVKLQEACLKDDSQVKQLEEIRARELELSKWRETHAQLKASIATCEANLARWRSDKAALLQNRTKGLVDLEETLTSKRSDLQVRQARLAELRKRLVIQEAAYQQQSIKQEEMNQERESLSKELVALDKEQQERRCQLNEVQYTLKTLSSHLDTLKAANAKRDTQLSDAMDALEAVRRATDSLTHDQSFLQRHLVKQKAVVNDLDRQLQLLLKQGSSLLPENPPPPPTHILNASQLGAYNSELAQKQAQLASLSGVNTHVIDMMASVEKKQQHLLQHVAIIKQDKEKIASTVRKLNAFKRDALEKTFKQVNK